MGDKLLLTFEAEDLLDPLEHTYFLCLLKFVSYRNFADKVMQISLHRSQAEHIFIKFVLIAEHLGQALIREPSCLILHNQEPAVRHYVMLIKVEAT